MSALEIHESAEAAILALLTDGKAQANFQGRNYTALDLDKLREISNYYRRLAIQRGELIPRPNEGPVNVSTARIYDVWGWV